MRRICAGRSSGGSDQPSTARGCSLDFDSAFGAKPVPPLDVPDSTVGQIYSSGAFSQIAEGWAEWLLEAGRLLAEDGIAVVGLAERRALRAAHRRGLGRIPDRDDGARRDERDSPNRSSSTRSGGSARIGAARSRESRCWNATGCGTCCSASPSAGSRPSSSSARRRATSASWRRRSRTPGTCAPSSICSPKRHRHELAELREETGRELMRRSFAAADLEWARRGPGSPATLAAAEYEATTSWRVTRPLRALGAMVRRLR